MVGVLFYHCDGGMTQLGFRIFSALLVLLIACAPAYSARQGSSINEVDETTKLIEIHGVVTQQRKYSIVVQSGLDEFEIKLPIRVPVQRELIRPELDFEHSKLSITLPCTGVGGIQKENKRVELPLPNPSYVRLIFENPTAKQAFLTGKNKRVAQYSLEELSKALNKMADGPNELSGLLIQSGNELFIETDNGNLPLILGAKTNLLSGFSIADLVQDSEVSILALEIENQLVAQDVRFQVATVTQAIDSENELPTMLSLGDMVSFSYQRALHEQFAEQFEVYHPPTNCGGSNNWKLLNRWLGDYRNESWDVVLFNCGMLDHSMSKEAYQSNLDKWITTILPASKQIVWISNTPIQGTAAPTSSNELVGRVSGRMKLQNQWAAEVIEAYPEIKTCDFWQLIKEGEESDFSKWWASSRPQFDYPQSKILANKIAEVLSE